MAELRQIFLCQTDCFKDGFMRHPHFQQTAGNFGFAFKFAFKFAFIASFLPV